MTASDRDLVVALRNELAAIDPARPCDRASEAAGLEGAIPGREPAVSRLVVRLGRDRPAIAPFDWDVAAEHCRMAWLRGLLDGAVSRRRVERVDRARGLSLDVAGLRLRRAGPRRKPAGLQEAGCHCGARDQERFNLPMTLATLVVMTSTAGSFAPWGRMTSA